MKSWLIFILFVGMFLIVTGIYEQKLKLVEKNVRVEYRFIPRSFYQEQLGQADVSSIFKNAFDKNDPWFDKTVGVSI
jgi:hypothetical protein